MEILLNVKAVTSANNIVALRKLHDKIESNVQGLTAPGVTSESYGSLLSSVLVQKLPPELRLIVGRTVSGEWILSALMKILGEKLEAREMTATPRDERSAMSRGNYHKSTAAALLSSSRAESTTFCCYCRGDHTPEACKTVTSRKEQRGLLPNPGRCYVRLKRGHIGRNCRSRARCRLCGDRHHTTICNRAAHTVSSPEFRPPPPPSRVNLGSQSPLNPTATPFNTTASATTTAIATMTATSCYAGVNQTVFLQTARATVFNPSNPARKEERGNPDFRQWESKILYNRFSQGNFGFKEKGEEKCLL